MNYRDQEKILLSVIGKELLRLGGRFDKARFDRERPVGGTHRQARVEAYGIAQVLDKNAEALPAPLFQGKTQFTTIERKS